jgi:HlyD family secretion protein
MMKLLAPIETQVKSQVKSLAKTARDLRQRVQDTSQRFAAMSRPAVLPEAVSFLDPIDELCEEMPPKFMQSTYYIVAGLFVSLIFISAIVKVDVVVSATGRLTTASPPIMLQSMDQSIIRELPVRAGDVVKKGQVVATLDPTFAQADLTSLDAQNDTLQAQIRRLQAERDGVPYTPGAAPTPADMLQQTLYTQRQAQYASQLRVFDEELRQQYANIKSTKDHRDSLSRQLKIAREVEAMRRTVMEKQVGSKLNFLEAQAARMRMEQELQDTANRISELEHQAQSKEAERQSFVDQWRHDVLDKLVATRTEATKIEQSMSKASLVNNMVVLTAPQDGVVVDVVKRSVGSVVRSAEPIVTMMASDAPLVAEININSTDVGYPRAGDDVVVKVDAFPYQRHGFLKGKLAYVGEESFGTGGGGTDSVLPQPTATQSGAYHRGRVELPNTKLDNLPPGARLIPGMTMVAEIKVGRRSVMSYFLNPLTRVLGESIREP